MKKTLLILLCTCTAAFAQSGKPNIVVYAGGHNDANVLRVLSLDMLAGFVNSGRYSEIPRPDEFYSKVYPGPINNDGIMALYKAHDVHHVCIVNMALGSNGYGVTAQIYDLTLMKVLTTHSVTSPITVMGDILKVSSDLVGALLTEPPAVEVAAPVPPESVEPQNDSIQLSSKPPAPDVCSLKVTIMPMAGGTVKRSPNQTSYKTGTSVTLTAIPNAGYAFSGWSSGTQNVFFSEDSVFTGTINSNGSLTAHFYKHKIVVAPTIPTSTPTVITETEDVAEKKKSSALKLTMRWGGATFAAVGLIGGIIHNSEVDRELDDYRRSRSPHQIKENRTDVNNDILTRNVFYTIAFVGASAFTITFFF